MRERSCAALAAMPGAPTPMRCRRALQAAALVTVACGSGTRIDSRPVASLPAPLTTLTVVSQVGAHGELAGAAFEGALLQGAAACGLRASVSSQLVPGASAALIVTWGGSTKDRHGSVRSIRYKATLFEPSSQRLLWQADLSLVVNARDSTDRPAAALARDLLATLRRDRVTPPCTTD